VEQLHTVDEQMRFSLPVGVRGKGGEAVLQEGPIR
jgi:hypothetical protein